MKTILLVDGDPVELKSQQTLLRRLGYDVIAETDGRAALTHIRINTGIAAVITECRLTDMDGCEFLEALRRHVPAIPVIVLTKHGAVESYLQCLNLGVYEYANNPVHPKELERIVTAALGTGRAGHRASA